jgi:cysteine desulfurase
MEHVYLDNAATTQIRDEVINEMIYAMKNNYGNPSSTHSYGRSSKSIIETCRKKIASCLNVSTSEILFTSGGTEANNLILRSAVRDLGVAHIITSKIEHHAVLHTIQQLNKEYKIAVDYVDLKPNGSVDLLHLETLLQTENKTLVSLMHINNEIGNILNLRKVVDLCKAHHALFHSDTVQSMGHYTLDLNDIQVDFLVASAHKFHGPKGVGFAFIRKNSAIKPLIFGGEQERGLRAGTESVHNIVGMTKALELSLKNIHEESAYLIGLKQYLIDKICQDIPEATFNGNSGHLEKSTYTLVNVCLPVDASKASLFLFQLDLKGIACSKGSACQSGSSQVSHVLAEIMDDEQLQKPSVRFSFSIYNTKEDIDYVVGALKELIIKTSS